MAARQKRNRETMLQRPIEPQIISLGEGIHPIEPLRQQASWGHATQSVAVRPSGKGELEIVRGLLEIQLKVDLEFG